MNKYFLFLSVFFVFSLSFVFSATITDCNYKASTSDIYYLQNDLNTHVTTSSNACIDINVADVIIDCNNHSIFGNGYNDGNIAFYTLNDNNITFRNCYVHDINVVVSVGSSSSRDNNYLNIFDSNFANVGNYFNFENGDLNIYNSRFVDVNYSSLNNLNSIIGNSYFENYNVFEISSSDINFYDSNVTGITKLSFDGNVYVFDNNFYNLDLNVDNDDTVLKVSSIGGGNEFVFNNYFYDINGYGVKGSGSFYGNYMEDISRFLDYSGNVDIHDNNLVYDSCNVMVKSPGDLYQLDLSSGTGIVYNNRFIKNCNNLLDNFYLTKFTGSTSNFFDLNIYNNYYYITDNTDPQTIGWAVKLNQPLYFYDNNIVGNNTTSAAVIGIYIGSVDSNYIFLKDNNVQSVDYYFGVYGLSPSVDYDVTLKPNFNLRVENTLIGNKHVYYYNGELGNCPSQIDVNSDFGYIGIYKCSDVNIVGNGNVLRDNYNNMSIVDSNNITVSDLNLNNVFNHSILVAFANNLSFNNVNGTNNFNQIGTTNPLDYCQVQGLSSNSLLISTDSDDINFYNSYIEGYCLASELDDVNNFNFYNNIVRTEGPLYFETNVYNFKVYNNDFNTDQNLNAESDISGDFNTSVQSGPNIVNGPKISGNYWGLTNGSGFSDTCTDGDNDGFCDNDFNVGAHFSTPVAGFLDYNPLSGAVSSVDLNAKSISLSSSSITAGQSIDINFFYGNDGDLNADENYSVYIYADSTVICSDTNIDENLNVNDTNYFACSHTFSTAGTYTIKGKIEYSGSEANTLNNEITTTLTVNSSSPGGGGGGGGGSTSTNHTPTVDITSPSSGASIEGSFTVKWTGSDEDGDSLTYKLYLDGTEKYSGSSTTYILEGVSTGSHTIKVEVSDGSDTSSDSITVNVTYIDVSVDSFTASSDLDNLDKEVEFTVKLKKSGDFTGTKTLRFTAIDDLGSFEFTNSDFSNDVLTHVFKLRLRDIRSNLKSMVDSSGRISFKTAVDIDDSNPSNNSKNLYVNVKFVDVYIDHIDVYKNKSFYKKISSGSTIEMDLQDVLDFNIVFAIESYGYLGSKAITLISDKANLPQRSVNLSISRKKYFSNTNRIFDNIDFMTFHSTDFSDKIKEILDEEGIDYNKYMNKYFPNIPLNDNDDGEYVITGGTKDDYKSYNLYEIYFAGVDDHSFSISGDDDSSNNTFTYYVDYTASMDAQQSSNNNSDQGPSSEGEASVASDRELNEVTLKMRYKEKLGVGETQTVQIFTEDNEPVRNAYIEIKGNNYDINGYTDDNGYFISTIDLAGNFNIFAKAKDRTLKGMFKAIEGYVSTDADFTSVESKPTAIEESSIVKKTGFILLGILVLLGVLGIVYWYLHRSKPKGLELWQHHLGESPKSKNFKPKHKGLHKWNEHLEKIKPITNSTETPKDLIEVKKKLE